MTNEMTKKFDEINTAIEKLETLICHGIDVDLGHWVLKPLEKLRTNLLFKEDEYDTEFLRQRCRAAAHELVKNVSAK